MVLGMRIKKSNICEQCEIRVATCDIDGANPNPRTAVIPKTFHVQCNKCMFFFSKIIFEFQWMLNVNTYA